MEAFCNIQNKLQQEGFIKFKREKPLITVKILIKFTIFYRLIYLDWLVI